MKCIYCGKPINFDEKFIDLKSEGCIHTSCLEDYNQEMSEIAELSTICFEDEDEDYDSYEGDD